ncbi:DUF4157 domain-containing protein [Flavobacterium sp.]|uniref:eCIS core domain-containing protein n=1 Tax=Flavobacterium sp. TaxID=239 RepID=UPI0031CE33AC
MREFEQKKAASHSPSPFFGPKVQKKITTGTVGDKYEVEADNVADKVVNKSKTGGLLQSKKEEGVQQKPISQTISTVQKQDLAQEQPVQKKGEKEEDKKVQKKSDKEEDKKVQKKGEKEEDKKVQKKGEKEEDKKVQKKSDKEEDKKVQKKGEKEEDKKVQKKCADCEKEEKVQKKGTKEEEKPVQKKTQNPETEIQNNELEGKLNSSKGNGNSLDKNTKHEMESGFGADFSNVKIHTDSRAVQMSQELGAQAFTNGNDVYFNEGKYNPGSKEGKHLLAHELTHTVQQTGMVQKSMEDHPENLQNPSNPQFKGNPPLEKANDNEMLISTGHKGGYVSEIQKGLLLWNSNALPKFGADGDFGNETRNAVLGFQIDNELNGQEGIVGPETMGTLDNVVMEQKGGKKTGGCESTVNFKKGPFQSETSAGFFSTAKCPNVTITIDAVAQIVEFHHCSTLEISIDHIGRTKRIIKIDNSGKGHFEETFTMKNHKDIHKLFFTMPEECKGMGDSFTVSGSIKRH